METRAHHVLIGSFVLAMLVGLVLTILWASGSDGDRDYDTYRIYFDTAVTGLSPSGEVRYSGLYVGTVTDIRLDPNNPSRVRVTIEVVEGTPITTNSVATLEVQGLTGVSFVQIIANDSDRATAGAPLEAPEGEDYPVIPSRVTGLQGVFMSAPELLDAGIRLLNQANKIVSDENIQKIVAIIDDIQTVTGGVAGRTPEIEEAIVLLRDALDKANQVALNINSLTEDELPLLIADLRTAAQNFEELGGTLNETVNENRPAIAHFTSSALPELGQFAVEARRLAAALGRIAERIEQGPADFIFPPKTPQIEAPAE
ncbi:MAG: MlaD family protein [Alphaproteobacteria bacterium]